MSRDEEANEQTHLLNPRVAQLNGRRRASRVNEIQEEDASSIISSHLSKEELILSATAIGVCVFCEYLRSDFECLTSCETFKITLYVITDSEMP